MAPDPSPNLLIAADSNVPLDFAEANGIRRFRAWVLADNRRMLGLIARLGDVQRRAFERGVIDLTFVIKPQPP